MRPDATQRCVLAVCGTELLLARAGGALPWTDVVCALILAFGLLLVPSRLAAPLIVSAGVLVPALWSRGTGALVWMLLAMALILATRRRALSPRAAVAAVAGAVGVVWLVVGVGQGQPPPLVEALPPVLALLAGLILGPWVVVLTPLALVPATGEAWAEGGPRRAGPDVLLVSVDTLRFDIAHEMTSLKVGELREGQAVAPWTLPSLATMHTGLLPSEHGAVRVEGGYSAATGATLAERFAAAGWDTAASVESPFTRPELGLQRGFARVRADGVRPWVLPRMPSSDRPHPTAALLFAADGGADQRAQDVAAFVRDRRDRPLFVWAHVLDAHLPYRHAMELDIPLLDRLWLTSAHRLAIGPAPSKETLAMIEGAYRHEVARVDLAVAKMRAAMPDAIFLLTSDHGEELGEHGGFEHGHSFYQELLSVPVYGEGLVLPAEDPIAARAVAPALLAAAGLGDAPPASEDAPSVNLLYGPLDARAVRRGASKLVVRDGVFASYDLRADPGEVAPGDDRTLAPALPPPPGGEAPVPLSGEATEALRALGYVE